LSPSKKHFSSRNWAQKVIVYEPIVAHHQYIKINVALNQVNAEIHEEGLGEKDGYRTIRYDAADQSFGSENKGTKEMKIRTKSASRIIEESGAEIAKFDCEGAEISLINVPNGILRKIESYIIEVHTSEIKNKVVDKFKGSGFALIKDISVAPSKEISVLLFQRNN
jgi:FkbM family methyltransferase